MSRPERIITVDDVKACVFPVKCLKTTRKMLAGAVASCWEAASQAGRSMWFALPKKDYLAIITAYQPGRERVEY